MNTRILVAAAVLSVSMLLLAALPAYGLKHAGNPVFNIGAVGQWDEAGVGAAAVLKEAATYKMWYTGVGVGPTGNIGYATSLDGIAWTRHAGNPVLAPGAPGSWDSHTVGSPVVIKDGATLKMWYTGNRQLLGRNIPQIGYATSANGITWTKQPSPVIAAGGPGTWHNVGVLSPWVIKDGATWKMWFTGLSEDPGLPGSMKIGYATSPDGVTWTEHPNPVLVYVPGSPWEGRGVGVASVIKEGTRYKMFYTGYAGFGMGASSISSNIGYASSNDGINWSRHLANPVISRDAWGSWEEQGIGAPSVLNDAGTYKVWYSGIEEDVTVREGYATFQQDVLAVVDLQGPRRPPAGRNVPLTVRFYNPYPTNLVATYDGGLAITDVSSSRITFLIQNGLTGTFDVTLQSPHNLVNLKRNALIEPPFGSLTMGRLLEGDANDSRRVDFTDYNILRATYGKNFGDPGFDARADFDRTGRVDVFDLMLLLANFGRTGPVLIP